MTAEDVTLYDIAGGHRPPLQFKLTHYPFVVPMTVLQLCDIVRETSFAIHCYLRDGHMEKVYENALANRLRKQSINVMQQAHIKVFDEDGTQLGYYTPQAQLLGYLRASQLRHGMLINLGAPKIQFKKLIR